MATKRGVAGQARAVLEWEQAAKTLAERGRVAWMVGCGLAEALAAIEQGLPSPDINHLWVSLIRMLDAPVPGGHTQGGVPGKIQSTSNPRIPANGTVDVEPETAVDLERRLDDHWYLVLFVGSVLVRGEWVTLAVGVDPSGEKHVLGLWAGATIDDAVARQVVQDLTRRGLRTEPGILVVTDGTQTLDAALEDLWGTGVKVAHCHSRVREEVLAHLPEKERAEVDTELQRAWVASADEAAHRLDVLIERLERNHPGAATRLADSREAVLTVARLALPRRLQEHLAVAGPIRVTVEHALRWGGSSARGVTAVRAGLPRAIRRMRRLIGADSLPILLKRLTQPREDRREPATK